MKLREHLLTEERLSSKDRRMFLKLIDNPKNTSFILSSFSKNYTPDEREVDVSKIGKSISFEYNADHYELTNTLIDIVDSRDDLSFNITDEPTTNTTIFRITKKWNFKNI